MHPFGIFGLLPLHSPTCHPNYGQGQKKKQKEIRLPVTPAVLKEKIVTSVLFIAGMPVIYMIVFS